MLTLQAGSMQCIVTSVHTHIPESNLYENGMEKERLLEAPSIGMLNVLPKDTAHPEF